MLPQSIENPQEQPAINQGSAGTTYTSNASRVTNNGIKFSQKSLNLRSARRALPKLYDAIKSNQNWGFFRLWWHLGSISEKEIAAALNKLSSDQKLVALKEIAENISNSPQSIRDDLTEFAQNYILDNLQEFLDYNKKKEEEETNITKNRDMLVDIVNKLPYDEKFQTSFEALTSIMVKIIELKSNKQDSQEAEEAELEIYRQALQSYEGSEYSSAFKKSVIDFFVKKYGDKGEATILENAWKFPPSDLQAKMIAACINYPLFGRVSSAKNITLLVNDVGEREASDGKPVIRRLLPKNQALDSFRNVVNNPALFDKNHENHGQSFGEFYSLFRTTQFFWDVIDRADTKEISFGKYTWKWQERLNDKQQKEDLLKQRTEDLLDTILKFCSNNPAQKDYEKAGKFAEKFFLNQNCSGNNSTLPDTVNTAINATMGKSLDLFVTATTISDISEARKILLTVTENNELISTEYYYFDKNDSSLQEALRNHQYYYGFTNASKSFSPDEYPNADKSFMIFCRTTKIDLNQENPEEIDINNDKNSSIFLTLGAP